jgi:hypothetical protein
MRGMESTPKSPGENPSKAPAEKVQGVNPAEKVQGEKLSEIAFRTISNLPAAKINSGRALRLRSSASAGADPQLENYKQLVARAVDVFGDEIKASKWLSLPNSELNGDTPLQFAQRHSYEGQTLEYIFIRIEHGIYI